ncbi:hypothetical protein AB2N04_04485 [Nitratireductor sp. GISD-1A_MAKvit]|uniref:hypothetical protein n=1 Tax=Nitratireductor sp. GISD-1A_MAKvit TaxID=3234198 RepID=UPI003467C648
MADFSAVLKKTIEGLSENTPASRERIYQKARATIENRLAAMDPAPSATVANRQRKLLEDAVAKVEAEYASPPQAEDAGQDEFDQIFAELDVDPVNPGVKTPEAPSDNAADEAVDPFGAGAARPEDGKSSERGGETARAGKQPDAAPGASPALETPPPPPPSVHREGGRKSGSGLVVVLALLFVVAAAAGAWFYKDDLARLANFEQGAESGATDDGDTASGDDAQDPATQDESDAADPSSGSDAAPAADPQPVRKFTQRLLPDGREVDEGPAGGQPELGEGTSVARATVPGSGDATTSGSAEPETGQQDMSADDAVPVGQKAIFYEERTSVSQGSADIGGVVWSVVQESPGNDLPPEPAIRAEATIPEKNLQLKMTLRRNADESLPASHILEIIFLTPDDFEGGGIDNVLRVSLKRSEQDTGNPLLGIPAKIADGFFLVALSDSAAETETNMLLLRRQRWIDIPVVYKSGRRALMTIEKGIPGDKVFTDVLNAWQNATSG